MSADLELIRFVFVVSILVVAFQYFRTQRVTGGTLTPGYVAILIVTKEWEVLLSVTFFTIVVLVLMRVVIMRWLVLTKPWVYGTGVMVSALLHAAIRGGDALFPLPEGLGLVLLAGLYITPGLIAYDLTQQGVTKTSKSILFAVAGTLLLSMPLLMTGVLPDAATIDFVGRIDPQWWWFVVGVAVPATLALRMARGLSTAGYIGAVFLIEIASVERLFVVAICAAISTAITRTLLQHVAFTPRQSFQLSMVLGGLTTWTIIFWTSRWGFVPARELNAFALEPIIVVGLITADLAKSTIPRSLVGVGCAVAIALVALWSTAIAPWAWIPTAFVLATVILAIGWPAIAELTYSARVAAQSGREFSGIRRIGNR
jgi:hypothetical protein